MSEDLLSSQNPVYSPTEANRSQPDAELAAERPTSAFPGWYPDPSGQAVERFWNGGRWTSQTKGTAVPSEHVDVDLVEEPRRDPNLDAARLDVASVVATKNVVGGPVDDRVRIVADSGDDIKILPSPLPAVEPEARTATRATRATTAAAHTVVDGTATRRRITEPQIAAKQSLFAPLAEDSRRATVPMGASARTPDVLRPKVSRRRAWFLGGVASVLFCGIGFGIGSASRQQETVEAQENLNESVRSAMIAGETTPVGDAVELQRRLDSLSSELTSVNDEMMLLRDKVDTATAEADDARLARDRLEDHNVLLQSWFTQEVRTQGQTQWDAELERACGLTDAGGVLDASQLQYTQAMELIGTEADLLLAVQSCLGAN